MSTLQESRQHWLGLRLRTVLLLSSLLVLVASALLSNQAEWVERYYSNGWSDAVGRGLAAVSGQFSSSLAEVLMVAFFLWLAISLLWGVRRIWAGQSGWGQSLRDGALRLLTLGCVLAALFYLSWGLNYSRPPLAERMGWQGLRTPQPNADQQVEELARMCRQLIEASNQAYLETYGSEKWRHGKAPLQPREIDSAIEGGYRRAATLLGDSGSWSLSRGPVKAARASLLMSYLGISGLYFPFTGEAHFNAMTPAVQLPHTIAHEKAHQLGIASEDEASFAGFLACLDADPPFVRYSGLVFAQRQLLNELMRLDTRRARDLMELRLDAVQLDISQANRFWRRFEGPAGRVSEAVNDSYLKFHGVRGGIESYRLSARLLILYARSRGGRVL